MSCGRSAEEMWFAIQCSMMWPFSPSNLTQTNNFLVTTPITSSKQSSLISWGNACSRNLTLRSTQRLLLLRKWTMEFPQQLSSSPTLLFYAQHVKVTCYFLRTLSLCPQTGPNCPMSGPIISWWQFAMPWSMMGRNFSNTQRPKCAGVLLLKKMVSEIFLSDVFPSPPLVLHANVSCQ